VTADGSADSDDAAVLATCTRLRHEIADWLDTLDEQQWKTPSLCDRRRGA
jgi:predicted Fe-S protein YdhL (DUF1289 family)